VAGRLLGSPSAAVDLLAVEMWLAHDRVDACVEADLPAVSALDDRQCADTCG
jgi:hypothetical protein